MFGRSKKFVIIPTTNWLDQIPCFLQIPLLLPLLLTAVHFPYTIFCHFFIFSFVNGVNGLDGGGEGDGGRESGGEVSWSFPFSSLLLMNDDDHLTKRQQAD
jgi:hypothetical protein